MSAGKDVFGDRTAAGPPQPFFHSRWVPAPAHVRDLGPDAGLPTGFRAAGVACGIKPSGQPRPRAARVRRRDARSARRASPTPGTPAAPVLLSQERCRLDGLRVDARQLRLRERRDRPARTRRRRQDPGRRGDRRGRRGVRGRARLDRRHQPVPAGRRGAEGHPRGSAASCAARATPTSSRRSRRPTRSRSAPACEVELSGGPVRLTAQCKGAGMISPHFATMFCFVQTDAELAARDGGSAVRGVRQALVRPLLGRRAALDERHRDPDVLGRLRRARSSRERGRAALRRGARRAAAPAGDHDGRRRRGRRPDRARARARRAIWRASRRRRARSPTRRS